jgi:two-component system KDP operon response regulator KdpE
MTRSSRILLVDDEMSIQRTVVPLLRSRGYEVDAATTGRDAVSAVTAQPPDVVILDLGLPDMDGLEVCARIRACSDVPIIVLSARDTERQKVAALDQGA